MREPRRSGATPPGGATWGPSPGFLAAALGLVAGLLAWWWWPAPAPVAAEPGAAPPVAASVPAPAAVAATPAPSVAAPARVATTLPPVAQPRIARGRDVGGDQTPDLADYVNEGDVPTAAEAIERLHRAGVHGGIAAFSPPGTRPPLLGLAVPEGFALPEGYVRHYQATDDGQRIEPILMFAPGYQPLSADGRPLAVPDDRVVPPELAPPGMPIRRIALPAPVDPGRR